ncbi:ATP-binding protein [Methylobacterium sp. WL69]|uniref:AlbA family DNA-binding domain-containing protein n=1 Tax=Methylobacterium sp. WL69 TaxID=2603893 RepID=UPI0011C87016|nr:ATP-binding protein [Methylobacterium sp. WL69]TXM71457.1 ATP-binding protein [Methylobacterium sp. WL69]
MSGNQLTFDFNVPLDGLPQLWTPDDIFDCLDQSAIERFKEDSRIERKRAAVSKKDLADNLSMWANTQPSGGIIFVGVEDDGTISGCKNIEQEHINEI